MNSKQQNVSATVRTATIHEVEIVFPTIPNLSENDVVKVVLQTGATFEGRPATQTVNLTYRMVAALANTDRY